MNWRIILFAKCLAIGTLMIACVGFILGWMFDGVMYAEFNKSVLAVEFIVSFACIIVLIVEMKEYIQVLPKEVKT